MFKFRFWAFTLLLPLLAPAASAQPSGQPTEQARLEAFREKFSKAVLDTCLKSPKSDSLTIPVSSYCRCYSSIFSSKYTPQEVVFINRFVTASSANSEAAQVFLAPLNRACIK